MNESKSSELDLTSFLRILRRRLWVVLLVPVLVAGAAFASASAKTPMFRSYAEILLGRTQAESIFDPLQNNYVDPNRLLANQIRVVQSQEVANLARERLGYPAEIKASAAKTEDVITLRAVDVQPGRAAAVANAYAEAYLQFRRSSGASENGTAQSELRRQIAAGEARLDALEDEVLKQPVPQREKARADLTATRQPVLTDLAAQRAQLSQLEAAANVDRGGAVLLAPATVPKAPFEPARLRSAVLGAALGLMLGLGLAFLLDYLDNRIRGKEELETITGGLPMVGLIPTLAAWRNRETTPVVSIDDPESSAAEAYRSLRTSIQFLGLDRALRTLQVTSPASSEGKTTTLVNLAVALARAGQRVVVVDCDLRRPRVHRFFGLDPAKGFTSVLVGDVALSGAIQEVPGVENLRVLPAGPVPPNPSELLSGLRTIEILAALQADADVVLIDSPPVLPVSDAAALSTRVDGTLMVVSANKTHRKQLARALELLHQVDAVVVGTILNRAGNNEGGYGDYGYGYRPYVQKPARPTRKAPRQATNGAAGKRPGAGAKAATKPRR